MKLDPNLNKHQQIWVLYQRVYKFVQLLFGCQWLLWYVKIFMPAWMKANIINPE